MRKYNCTKSIAIIFLFILISVFVLTGCNQTQGISGDEWLLMQQEDMEDLQSFSASMDEVYTLYTMGSISSEDFYNEVMLLKEQYDIMQALHQIKKNKNPVRPEGYSYIAQRGIEGIENVRELLEKILNESIDTNGTVLSSSEIAYLYLLYREEINQNLAAYLVSYEVLSSNPTTSQYDILTTPNE